MTRHFAVTLSLLFGRCLGKCAAATRWRAESVCMVGLLLSALAMPAALLGQSTWEVTPYQVKVWWTVDDAPEFPEVWQSGIAPKIEQLMRARFVGVCETKVAQAPKEMQLAMRRSLGSLSREQLFSVSPDLGKSDKLFLVRIENHRQVYAVHVQEFDCLLTHFGPVVSKSVHRLAEVVPQAMDLISESFSPVVRIDRAAAGIVKSRLRAAALMQSRQSPGTLAANEVLLPYDRKVKSTGESSLENIRPIDWTYLESIKPLNGPGVHELQIVSGYRQAFRSKRSRRIQQYAIRTRPLVDQSTVRLLSRSEKLPLSGYEIHEKGESVTNFVGYTDWKGELAIPKSGNAIRVLLVRSGQKVIAKLPIVPGLRQEVIAYIRDNRIRVQADGFLSGIQMGIIDLVAKRESLTTRIRNRISEKEFDKAEDLLNQFRKLPSKTEFRTQVERQLALLNLDENATDSNLRRQITSTFVDTLGTLGQYLDEDRGRQLENELAAARGG